MTPQPTFETQEATTLDWSEANRLYLEGRLYDLRLRLQRRVRWLRRQWHVDDPLQGHPEVITEQQADWRLAGEDREAEARFYRQDEHCRQISEALTQTAQELDDLAAAMVESGAPPALVLLGTLFNLSDFERHLLVLALAPTWDPAFADLYAYVQDHANLRYPTLHLAQRLFASDVAGVDAAHNSLLPEASLRRFALLTVEPPPWPAMPDASRPLKLPARVADYLRGINRLDSQVIDLLHPLAPAPLPASQRAVVDRVARLLAARRTQLPVVNLIGPAGVGKQAVAAAICEELGLQLHRLTLPEPRSEAPPLHPLLEREALVSGLAYYMKTPGATSTALLERLEGLLFLGTEGRWAGERRVLSVAVSRPTAEEQQALWQQALAERAPDVQSRIPVIVQQFDFGPATIGKVVTEAEETARLRASNNGAPLTADDLWQACRRYSSPHLEHLAQRLEPAYVWEDIVLPDDLYTQLRELANQVAHRYRVYESWGFGARLNRGRGISALFAGPSGTGKTMAAEILANHLQLDLYRIDLSGVVSKYIGETEKNLKHLFDAAEQSGAILFFDEADALFGKRTEVKDSHDRYANIEINYLLQRMEAYRGLAILATNRKSALDRAFLRRLRFLLDFPFPDLGDRQRIWQRVFPVETPLAALDYQALARLEVPGGNIHNIALNAAFLAADDAVEVEMRHVMHAARREYDKIDRMITPAEFGEYYEEATRE
jgi:ATP-dependent 26S proteasome regulatory subunit